MSTIAVFNRRTFLKLLPLAGALSPSAARARSSVPGTVVVLGGGLAGLAAAWNLMGHGYDVTVLEAQAVPGGRVRTVREPFAGGTYAEAGAVRVAANHAWTMKYIRAMGLESKLRPFDQDGAQLWYLQGKRFTTPASEWPIEGLTPEERTNPFAMVRKYWGPDLAAAGDPTSPDFPARAIRALDGQTFEAYLRRRGASDAWVRLMLASEGNVGRMSALAVTTNEAAASHGHGVRMYGLVGGNDQLPAALATSEAKMAAIATCRLIACARLYVQTKSRFWRQDRLGPLGGLNMAATDTEIERIWNTSALQPGPRGMLQSYMFDDRAAEFAGRSEAERVAAWTRTMSRVLPGLAEHIETTWTKIWQDDPWQRGAFVFMRPNEFATMWPAARSPEGRVHFAGEHTSLWFGWQNGALESAERCVLEILTGRTAHATAAVHLGQVGCAP